MLKSWNIFAENINTHPLSGNVIRQLCSRHFGIGGDGLFIVSSSKESDFLLDYYNADGTWETLCANGSRCAVLLMNQLNKIKKMCTFSTGSGTHAAQFFSNGTIEMTMGAAKYKTGLISPEDVDGYFIDTGAKHFVCESKNLSDEYIYDVGKKIRFSEHFLPEGINVNFFQIDSPNSIHIKTYEKGVEAIMQSCASGSSAVVFHLAQQKIISSPVTTRSPGGSLFFSFDKNGNDLKIKGPAKIVFSGFFTLSD